MPDPVCAVCGGAPTLQHTGWGITINRNLGGSGMRSDERLYLTVDRERVVREGDPEAAFLLVNEGGEVPAEYNRVFREYRKASEADDDAEPRAAAGAPTDPDARPDGEAQPDTDVRPDAEGPPDDDEDAKARAAPARTKARTRAEDK